jgi:hypothetical protein
MCNQIARKASRKTEVELTVDDKSEKRLAALHALGFEVIATPESTVTVIGRIAVEKLESLLDVSIVSFVSPHR